jgi:hypothetical protein
LFGFKFRILFAHYDLDRTSIFLLQRIKV